MAACQNVSRFIHTRLGPALAQVTKVTADETIKNEQWGGTRRKELEPISERENHALDNFRNLARTVASWDWSLRTP